MHHLDTVLRKSGSTHQIKSPTNNDRVNNLVLEQAKAKEVASLQEKIPTSKSDSDGQPSCCLKSSEDVQLRGAAEEEISTNKEEAVANSDCTSAYPNQATCPENASEPQLKPSIDQASQNADHHTITRAREGADSSEVSAETANTLTQSNLGVARSHSDSGLASELELR